MRALIVLASLFLASPVLAQDLGMAGALSGFGQGMGRGFEQMQSGIIQQGLMQQRFENERKLREQQQQQVQDERQLRQTIQSDRLKQEAQWLDEKRDGLDKQQQKIFRMKEAGNPQWEAEAMVYGKSRAEHHLFVEAYIARVDQYYRYWNIAPPPGYEREVAMMRQAMEKHQRDQAASDRHTQESVKAERVPPQPQLVEHVTPDWNNGQTPEEKLNSLRPGWRTIIGAPGSDAPYRQWLKRQPKAYQKLINDSATPEEINESIGEFLDSSSAQMSGR